MCGVAAQNRDLIAALAIPEVNGVATALRHGRNPLAIRTVSQIIDLRRIGPQDGKLTASSGITQVHVLPRTDGHPLAIYAKRERNASLLPFPKDRDLLSGGSVPQPARAGP